MVNLISNAVKFTKNGKIEIKLKYDFKENTLRTKVRDSGTGIKKE